MSSSEEEDVDPIDRRMQSAPTIVLHKPLSAAEGAAPQQLETHVEEDEGASDSSSEVEEIQRETAPATAFPRTGPSTILSGANSAKNPNHRSKSTTAQPGPMQFVSGSGAYDVSEEEEDEESRLRNTSMLASSGDQSLQSFNAVSQVRSMPAKKFHSPRMNAGRATTPESTQSSTPGKQVDGSTAPASAGKKKRGVTVSLPTSSGAGGGLVGTTGAGLASHLNGGINVVGQHLPKSLSKNAADASRWAIQYDDEDDVEAVLEDRRLVSETNSRVKKGDKLVGLHQKTRPSRKMPPEPPRDVDGGGNGNQGGAPATPVGIMKTPLSKKAGSNGSQQKNSVSPYRAQLAAQTGVPLSSSGENKDKARGGNRKSSSSSKGSEPPPPPNEPPPAEGDAEVVEPLRAKITSVNPTGAFLPPGALDAIPLVPGTTGAQDAPQTAAVTAQTPGAGQNYVLIPAGEWTPTANYNAANYSNYNFFSPAGNVLTPVAGAAPSIAPQPQAVVGAAAAVPVSSSAGAADATATTAAAVVGGQLVPLPLVVGGAGTMGVVNPQSLSPVLGMVGSTPVIAANTAAGAVGGLLSTGATPFSLNNSPAMGTNTMGGAAGTTNTTMSPLGGTTAGINLLPAMNAAAAANNTPLGRNLNDGVSWRYLSQPSCSTTEGSSTAAGGTSIREFQPLAEAPATPQWNAAAGGVATPSWNAGQTNPMLNVAGIPAAGMGVGRGSSSYNNPYAGAMQAALQGSAGLLVNNQTSSNQRYGGPRSGAAGDPARTRGGGHKGGGKSMHQQRGGPRGNQNNNYGMFSTYPTNGHYGGMSNSSQPQSGGSSAGAAYGGAHQPKKQLNQNAQSFYPGAGSYGTGNGAATGANKGQSTTSAPQSRQASNLTTGSATPGDQQQSLQAGTNVKGGSSKASASKNDGKQTGKGKKGPLSKSDAADREAVAHLMKTAAAGGEQTSSSRPTPAKPIEQAASGPQQGSGLTQDLPSVQPQMNSAATGTSKPRGRKSRASSKGGAAHREAGWHAEAATMGWVDEETQKFVKDEKFSGRLSALSENQVRTKGVHRYCVSFHSEWVRTLSSADGLGFVFSDKLPCTKNIQKIKSIFLNKKGQIMIRRESELVKPQHKNGVERLISFENESRVYLQIDLDKKEAAFWTQADEDQLESSNEESQDDHQAVVPHEVPDNAVEISYANAFWPQDRIDQGFLTVVLKLEGAGARLVSYQRISAPSDAQGAGEPNGTHDGRAPPSPRTAAAPGGAKNGKGTTPSKAATGSPKNRQKTGKKKGSAPGGAAPAGDGSSAAMREESETPQS